MKESQAEIQAIQAKLRALQLGRTRQPAGAIEPPRDEAAMQTESHRAHPQKVADTVESLQQRSTAYVRQLQQPSSLNQANPNLTKSLQRLETQAERINQLSIAQETALLELKAIVDQIEHDRKTLDRSGEGSSVAPVCEYLKSAVPQVERDPDGGLVVTLRSVDLFRAEREAAMTAQTLRRRARQTSRSLSRRRPAARPQPAESQPSELAGLLQQVSTLLPSQQPRRRSAQRLRRSQAEPTPPMTVTDAAIWVIGATVARMGLDLLLASVPHLWLPVVGLIATPAAIAIYRTAFTPEVGFVWGYRLFLVMVGLLLGGRL